MTYKHFIDTHNDLAYSRIDLCYNRSFVKTGHRVLVVRSRTGLPNRYTVTRSFTNDEAGSSSELDGPQEVEHYDL